MNTILINHTISKYKFRTHLSTQKNLYKLYGVFNFKTKLAIFCYTK